jgi:Rrf2 family protein
VKLTAQEEYGLRCLVQVARRAPDEHAAPATIRDIADAEGLSVDYVAKLLRILRRAGLVDSERGATGGYRLGRPADRIAVADILGVLDTPLYTHMFCDGHTGRLDSCAHSTSCSIRALWRAMGSALQHVLKKVTLADLLDSEQQLAARLPRVGEEETSRETA